MTNTNPYAKSCIRVYNNAAQTISATPVALQLAGTAEVESGCSLSLNPSSIRVNKSGLYHFSADVTVNPTAAGIVTAQLYNNGVPIPSAFVRDSAEAGNIAPIHIETDLCLGSCCGNRPQITLVVFGVAGTVTNLSMGAVKWA